MGRIGFSARPSPFVVAGAFFSEIDTRALNADGHRRDRAVFASLLADRAFVARRAGAGQASEITQTTTEPRRGGISFSTQTNQKQKKTPKYMTTIRTLLLVMLGFLAFPTASYSQGQPPAQTPTEQRELTPEERALIQRQNEEAKKVCAICGGGIATVIGVIVTLIALNIALLIWVARDAKSRGMDSSVLWMFLVMFTSVIGLVIYLFSRPQGELIRCGNCRGKRLKVSATCPHCQHA